MTAALLELPVMPSSSLLLLCLFLEFQPTVWGDAGVGGLRCSEAGRSSHLLSLACLQCCCSRL